MKIGIDGRLMEETGVGRYIRNLVVSLAPLDIKNHYVIFLRKKSFDSFTLPNSRWEKRLADVPWHTISEQFVMPWLLVKEHLDLVHVPYFNVPIFYPGKLIVTIHDLTILHLNTGKASTLPLPLYKLRRLGYYLVLAVGLMRAVRVIAVSNTVKQEIIDHFHIPSEKIDVTYEGVDIRTQNSMTRTQKPLIQGKYFLYVGNAYPHKNLETLLQGFSLFSKENPFQNKLILVGKEDYFYQRLKKYVANNNLSDRVIFFGQASEQELIHLYKSATALVFPSLMEGFGLPGLEAMAAGTPVVCSDIPVFHEIYGDAAFFVDTQDQEKLTSSFIKISTDQILRTLLIRKGKTQAGRYHWREMAKKTLDVYARTT